MNQDLIHSGSHSFYVETLFCKHAIDQKLRFYFDEKERKIFHNSTPLPIISNLLGLMQGIVMTPDDVNMIKGPPALRRQFLDIQLAQADPLYVHFLGRYAKAMRQRNQLLKQKKSHSIESWEHEMAQSAAYLILQRRRCVDKLQVHSQKFYSYLTGESEDLTLEYRSTASECKDENDIKKFYHHQYRKNREREMMLGTTLSGPHRDDFSIAIRSRDARFFASEGQQRSCVAALHLGEWLSLKETAEEIPLFMIDDIGISLDDHRRGRLLDLLSSMGQVFITSTDESLLSSLACQKKIILLPLAAKMSLQSL
jgi:DNA replication and repair protein RecF